MPLDLRAFLLERGASESDIEGATREGWLPLLAIDRVLMPGAPCYDLAEVARRAGTGFETARRIWRALGFPDIPAGVAAFTDHDVEMLRLAVRNLEPEVNPHAFDRQTRVFGSSLARIAAVEAEMIADLIDDLRSATTGDAEIATFLIEAAEWGTIEQLIDYTHRLQLRAAVWRRLARDVAGAVDLGVGFADLVGYTALSAELDEDELADLLTRFEALVFDTTAERRGRVVKTIGDEVMFVGVASDVADIALDVTMGAASDPALPPVRAGIACGPLLARDGDYYGPVVNLASRLTEQARPGTVLTSEAMRETLLDEPRFAWRDLGRRRLRSMGDVEVWALRRDGPP